MRLQLPLAPGKRRTWEPSRCVSWDAGKCGSGRGLPHLALLSTKYCHSHTVWPKRKRKTELYIFQWKEKFQR